MSEVVNHWCSSIIVAIMATVNAKSAKPAIFVIFYIIGVDVLATIDRIVALLAEQSKKQKDLTDYLGLEKGAFTKWKKGENESYMKRINEISEFFDVSVDYLLCNTDIKKEPSIEEDAEL